VNAHPLTQQPASVPRARLSGPDEHAGGRARPQARRAKPAPSVGLIRTLSGGSFERIARDGSACSSGCVVTYVLRSSRIAPQVRLRSARRRPSGGAQPSPAPAPRCSTYVSRQHSSYQRVVLFGVAPAHVTKLSRTDVDLSRIMTRLHEAATRPSRLIRAILCTSARCGATLAVRFHPELLELCVEAIHTTVRPAAHGLRCADCSRCARSGERFDPVPEPRKVCRSHVLRSAWLVRSSTASPTTTPGLGLVSHGDDLVTP